MHSHHQTRPKLRQCVTRVPRICRVHRSASRVIYIASCFPLVPYQINNTVLNVIQHGVTYWIHTFQRLHCPLRIQIWSWLFPSLPLHLLPSVGGHIWERRPKDNLAHYLAVQCPSRSCTGLWNNCYIRFWIWNVANQLLPSSNDIHGPIFCIYLNSFSIYWRPI